MEQCLGAAYGACMDGGRATGIGDSGMEVATASEGPKGGADRPFARVQKMFASQHFVVASHIECEGRCREAYP